MSAIDTQNAKQIRDPMDVLITLTLDNTEISMAYSGYSSTAKVADGVLDKKDWPMRGLADLQADGFPLDGTHVLYDYSTSPSQTNGKLGVRGHVGQSVSVTATGDGTIASIGIDVTGAASVTLNGETTEITGSAVSLQLLDTTAALTFAPASETARIEVINIFPETDFYITNDNLIKATVSLRSDLSIVDPTLPESELNVEVYHDIDISEAVAQIPDDTPITYQAGYPGDMSPVRKFYVAGQVTWADNALNIHAVDAVHFLDVELFPRLIYPGFLARRLTPPQYLTRLLAVEASRVGVRILPEIIEFKTPDTHNDKVQKYGYIPRGTNLRDLLAFASNVFKFTDLDDYVSQGYTYPPEGASYWCGYVDAGIPKLNTIKQHPKWAVVESDCGSNKKNVEPVIDAITVEYQTADATMIDALFDKIDPQGSVTWNGETGFVDIDSKAMLSMLIGLSVVDVPNVPKYNPFQEAIPVLPVSSGGSPREFTIDFPNERYTFLRYNPSYGEWRENPAEGRGGRAVIDSDSIQTLTDSTGSIVYSQVVPSSAPYNNSPYWNWESQSDAWNALIAAGYLSEKDQTAVLKVFGGPLLFERIDKKYPREGTAKGKTVAIKSLIDGLMGFGDDNVMIEAYPEMAYKALLDRSNITCSFTWKGDPRIQPRDVFIWERLDGSEEEWTFENITLTHEKGGTIAEITARKGIV